MIITYKSIAFGLTARVYERNKFKLNMPYSCTPAYRLCNLIINILICIDYMQYSLIISLCKSTGYTIFIYHISSNKRRNVYFKLLMVRKTFI